MARVQRGKQHLFNIEALHDYFRTHVQAGGRYNDKEDLNQVAIAKFKL
jgi:hypothetical protein